MKQQMNRLFIWTLVCVMLVLSLPPLAANAQNKKPNFVMIMTDDVGWGDLGSYGGGIMRGAPQVFRAIRVRNFKMVFTAKDTWLGPSKSMKAPAIYDLRWDPGEQFDIAFNGAMPMGGSQTSPGRASGSDNGWIGILTLPPLMQFLEELKTHPNLLYVPSGEGMTGIIPKELQ